MYCSECGIKFASKSKFCSKCGTSLSQNLQQHNVALSGEVGVGGIIGDGNSIYVENYENYKFNIREDKISYQKRRVNPISVTRKGISKFGKINTVLGLLGSIASIVSIFGGYFNIQLLAQYGYLPITFGLLLIIGTLSLLISTSLQRRGFIRIPLIWGRGVNFEEENGRLVITTIEGECISCKGKVHLVSTEGSILGICDKNPGHKFDFDYTTYTGKPV